MRKIIVAIWIIALMGVGVSSAQEDDYPECEFESTHQILLDMIEDAQTWQQLEQFNAALSESLAFCRGLFFEGTGSQVVGPVHFPTGTYTLHLSGDSFTTIQGDIIDGSCDAELLYLGIEDGQPSTERPFHSQDCETTFSIQAEGAWLLRFEPIDVVDSGTPSDGIIAYGAQVQGNLPANGVVEYRFASEPGDIVTIGAVTLDDTADLQLDLFTQDDDLLTSDDDSHPQGIWNPQITALPLPAAGEYRIVVRHCAICSTNEPATFVLTLEKVN